MQVILDADEAWSIMTLVVSQVLDGVDLSPEARNAVRAWRTERAEGSFKMGELAEGMNEVLSATVEEREAKPVRRRGRYQSSKDRR